MPKLPKEFYLQDDTLSVSVQLLGKELCTLIDGKLTTGIIVETEAYNGIGDKASHAYGDRRTNRTATMYEAGGVAYVYLCYGIHHLLNVVISGEGVPKVVLIRAVEPVKGLQTMLLRRSLQELHPRVTSGPGSTARALGIDQLINGADFMGDKIWIEDNGLIINPLDIISTPRVGIAYAQEHALLPWRYFIKGNRFVSKPNSL